MNLQLFQSLLFGTVSVLALPPDDVLRCSYTNYRRTLAVMASCPGHRKDQQQVVKRTAPSSHINYRYLSSPEKIDHLHRLHEDSQSIQKKVHRLRSRITQMISSSGVTLDDEIISDLHEIMQDKEQKIFSHSPQDSFQHMSSSRKKPLVETNEACTGIPQ